MIQLIGNVLIIASAACGVGAAVLYGTCFPWWTSSDGRHLFSYMAVIGGVLALWTGRVIALGTWFGPQESGSWPWIRLIAFALIAWVLGWRLVKIIKAWRE